MSFDMNSVFWNGIDSRLTQQPKKISSVSGLYGSPANDGFNYDGVVPIGAGIGGRKEFRLCGSIDKAVFF